MKYVLQWTTRSAGSAEENLAAIQRSLEVLGKWTPSTTIHQFVARVDGSGGFAIGETDDMAVLARDCAIFTPYVEVVVHPVLDMQQGAEALAAGVEFNRTT